MKIGIITSNALRHRFFVNTISKKFTIELLLIEPKVFNPNNQFSTIEEKTILDDYFRDRELSEIYFFSTCQNLCNENINKRIMISKKDYYDNDFRSLVENSSIDLFCVFGSSILPNKFIVDSKAIFINMHLGLSPYCRGSGTNFFPFVNNEVQFVGVTVHLLTSEVDGGAIIHQARPEINIEDSIHSIGNKTIIKGADLMVKSIYEYLNGELTTFPQLLSTGTVYRRKDFSAQKVVTALKNIQHGCIKEYIDNKSEIDIKYPIIE